MIFISIDVINLFSLTVSLNFKSQTQLQKHDVFILINLNYLQKVIYLYST